ncbi:MAG: lysine--tRNA ligase [Kiritimatiellae bacterium]|nr:lysine--tRNA ligase [Kiritimatiellia bacterium]MBR4522714.1 lysine--tRNA ligase [Kiritimatiellia bacterium]
METNEYREQRLQSLGKLRELGFEPYGRKYEHTDLKVLRQTFVEGAEARVAGRLMMIRKMGKMNFATIDDGTGRFQLIFKRDELSETQFAAFKQLNLGDIIGVEGTLFTTQKGEKSVICKEWTMLAKALEQPPEKFHGLADQEEKYRRRYVDLMTNEESRNRFFMRSDIIRETRKYLWDRGFYEVETPILQGQAGGAAAKPFETHFNALDQKMVLRIAPELYLKRLIVGGMNKVFELGKDFRNEGIDRSHNPEFTVCEIYEAYGDRTSMEDIMEGLLPHLCDTVVGKRQIEYGENKEIIDFTPPYRRVAYRDLVKELMGDDWFELNFDVQLAKAKELAKARDVNLELDGVDTELMLTHEIYDKIIEKGLRQPTFVTRLPHEFVPLAKACPDDPSLVDVFEFVVAGRELCPGYTEQNNPIEQRKALEHQAGEDTEKVDEDFISALECGMPPTGGLGFGVDRLVMLLTGCDGIRDVVLFPQMKKA